MAFAGDVFAWECVAFDGEYAGVLVVAEASVSGGWVGDRFFVFLAADGGV